PPVRAEAAGSLGKMRPISQQAGYALEQAQNNDGVMRVRLAARQALWQYHLVGYRGGKPAETPAANAGAPPTMVTTPPGPATPAVSPRGQPTSRGGSLTPAMVRETPEPPLAPSSTAP